MTVDTLVIVPCYNEARRFRPAAFTEFLQATPRARLMFVNDGSTDDTPAVLAAFCQDHPGRSEVLDLPVNQGKAEAVRQGFLRVATSSGIRFVGYWDADLATPLSMVGRFVDLLEESSSLVWVIGARVRLLGRSIERRALRHYLGRVFAAAVSLALDLRIYDSQCGAKLVRWTPSTAALFAKPFVSRWIFDVEILFRMKLAAKASPALDPVHAVYEFPLPQWEDVAGSKVTARAYLRASRDFAAILRAYGPAWPIRSKSGTLA